MRALVLLSIVGITLAGLVACGGGKSSNSNNAASAGASQSAQSSAPMDGAGANAQPPNCGAVQAVWVNLKTKVYHEPGDPYYGKTAHGEYLCPSSAKAKGYRPSGGAMTHHS